jgi:hypothetical protein
MEQKIATNRIFVLIICFIVIVTDGICQVTVKSKNRIEDFNSSYYERANPQDTVIIILDFDHLEVEKSLKKWKFRNVGFIDKIFKKKYLNLQDSCIELKFIHHPGPPMGNDTYWIDKRMLNQNTILILEEKDIPFTYWFKNDSDLFDKTLILVNSNEWSKKEKNIEGLGVQIYTTGSCKDLIENH